MQQTIKANGEDCLLDIAAGEYGNVSALFAIALSNGLDIDAVPGAGIVIVKPEVPEAVAYKTLVNKRKPAEKAIVSAGTDQALIDLAMQETGGIEALFTMAVLNKISITDDLVIGQQYKKSAVATQKIVDVFTGAHKPASNMAVSEDQLPAPQEGIDYWYIEVDFKVS